MGVAAVALLYAAVTRISGRAAGLVAAVVFTSAESSLLAIDAHNAHRVVSVSFSTAIG